MITATEALRLSRASLTADETREAVAVIDEIDQHIRETVTFSGVPPIRFLCPNVPPKNVEVRNKAIRISSANVAKAVCLCLNKQQWTVLSNMMATPPAFPGGRPEDHHWVFTIQPLIEAYDGLLPTMSILK